MLAQEGVAAVVCNQLLPADERVEAFLVEIVKVHAVAILFQCRDDGRGDGGVQAVGVGMGEDNADVLHGDPMGWKLCAFR